MDRITALAAFVRTVELGSQAAASEDLGLSRAMIGRHIQQPDTFSYFSILLSSPPRRPLGGPPAQPDHP